MQKLSVFASPVFILKEITRNMSDFAYYKKVYLWN